MKIGSMVKSREITINEDTVLIVWICTDEAAIAKWYEYEIRRSDLRREMSSEEFGYPNDAAKAGFSMIIDNLLNS